MAHVIVEGVASGSGVLRARQAEPVGQWGITGAASAAGNHCPAGGGLLRGLGRRAFDVEP
ncbi:hypothetical protein EYF80_057560 [Liparis tanakae]|uniref:Uncharacterized protein n=1 Tax=Liparis tanakae TaxID=230148 RepID=A0A4Z2EU09_9TELE|nr:hypothetical protein EYF80_057560 [Liparis tanakae]